MNASNGGIALFLPCYNEAENLPAVVGDAVGFLEDLMMPYSIIIVDDGSCDNTTQVCAELISANQNIQVVRHPVNLGYGTALRTGLKIGLETRHDWIGFCDADGQFKPSDIQLLIQAAEEQATDVAIGYRVQRADGLHRRLMGRGWHYVSQLALGYSARDVDCGFKVFRRHIVEELLPELIGTYNTLSPELLARISRHGFPMVEVGVNHYPRSSGESQGASVKVIVQSFRNLRTVRNALHNT